jgi:hypothetical protein
MIIYASASQIYDLELRAPPKVAASILRLFPFHFDIRRCISESRDFLCPLRWDGHGTGWISGLVFLGSGRGPTAC